MIKPVYNMRQCYNNSNSLKCYIKWVVEYRTVSSHSYQPIRKKEIQWASTMRYCLGMGGFDPMRGHDALLGQAALLGSAYHQQQIVHRKFTCIGVVSVWYRCCDVTGSNKYLA